MKAVVYEKYGSPDVLDIRDIPRPVPKDHEVLIKVIATTVTAGDWRLRKADPFLARIFNGLFKPTRVKVLGFELAGIIEEVGKKVTAFKPGDEVFAHCGLRFGGYAEYACLPANELMTIKPSNLTFEEAAAVPIGGLTAYRFLRQSGLEKNDRILIYGASGSVGTYAIQIARAMGAEVTAVCGTDNIPMVTQLGAHNTIDYKKADFTKINQQFDFIFDAVGKTSKSACKSILLPGGKYLTVKGNPKSSPDDLQRLTQWITAGSIKPVMDRTYTLDQIREVHTYVESFRKKGNVVVRVME